MVIMVVLCAENRSAEVAPYDVTGLADVGVGIFGKIPDAQLEVPQAAVAKLGEALNHSHWK